MRLLISLFLTSSLLASAALAMPPRGAGGGHDGYGQGLASPDLPLGVLTVKVVAGGNMANANAGAKVALLLVSGAEPAQPVSLVVTGADGRARFEGLTPGQRYQAHVKGATAASARSQVVTMPPKGGLRLLLSTPGAATSRPVAATSMPTKVASGEGLAKTTDRSVLSLVSGTHVVGQAGEGDVQCMQVLVLRNGSKKVFDPGAGLRFPVPDGAANAALGKGAQGKLRLAEDGKSVLLVAPLPPGSVTLRFTYQFGLEGSRIDFRQVLPVRQETTLFAITNSVMVGLQGPALLRTELREQGGGKQLPVHVLRPVAANVAMEFTVTNLPFRDPTMRTLVVGLSIVLALWGIFGVFSGGRRTRVQQRRCDGLLDQLAALMTRHEAKELSEAAFEQERAKLLKKLRTTWDE